MKKSYPYYFLQMTVFSLSAEKCQQNTDIHVAHWISSLNSTSCFRTRPIKWLLRITQQHNTLTQE